MLRLLVISRPVSVAIRRRGNTRGCPRPPIVLLHGFTGDASTMDVLAERLERDHTVVVPDLMGHGDSSGPASAHSVDAMAAHVLEMVAALEIETPFDLVGYSMGGRVALTLACTRPDAVASVALIGASAGLADPTERAERAAADDALADALVADGLEAFVDRCSGLPDQQDAHGGHCRI